MSATTAASYTVAALPQHLHATQKFCRTRPASCAASRRHRRDNFRTSRCPCHCSNDKDSQPQLTRQSVKQAISTAMENEKPYLLKLLVASVAGAATVKFGSLAIDTPFHPSLFTAIGIITLPCIAFSIILWKLPE